MTDIEKGVGGLFFLFVVPLAAAILFVSAHPYIATLLTAWWVWAIFRMDESDG